MGHKIIALEVANIKRISAVEIMPGRGVTVIGGRNRQGKSSILDAIEMALGGQKSIPAEPIKRGARKARIVLDLDDFTIERTFTANGGSSLAVRDKDGNKQSSPQSFLDKLCDRGIAFDPIAFANDDAKRQADTLRALAGLDFTEQDQLRSALHEERRTANRQLKEAEAKLAKMQRPSDAPTERIDVSALSRQVADNNELAARIAKMRDILAGYEKEKARCDAEIQQFDEQIAELQRRRGEVDHRCDLCKDSIARVEASISEAGADPDSAGLLEQIAEADGKNAKIDQLARYKEAHAEVRKLEDSARVLTDRIQGVDDDKRQAIAKADFPIPGLGFDTDGMVTFNDLPLTQASQAERLRISAAIGIAMHPELRVLLIRQGAFLDDDAMADLDAFAQEHDTQILLERVGTRDAGAIIIEDGTVLAEATDAAE